MRGFILDESGDIVVKNGEIEFVSDNELIRQTCETVIGTNKGEWFLNIDEGITFDNIIMKNPDFDVIKGEILMGLQQVDNDFKIDNFKYNLNDDTRKLTVSFTASTQNQTITTSYTY